jgi:hypothetical protein
MANNRRRRPRKVGGAALVDVQGHDVLRVAAVRVLDDVQEITVQVLVIVSRAEADA